MEKYLVPLKTEASKFYDELLDSTQWQKTAKINRWVALHEIHDQSQSQSQSQSKNENQNESGEYKYRDAPGATQIGFSDTLLQIKTKAENWYTEKTGASKQVVFNVCLLNFYENGQQRIGWHSDREEIGRTTPIASVSLGATRQFLVRAKADGIRDRASIHMQSGSLLWMENICQHDYIHSVPKENNVTEGRINLTFRCKLGNTQGEEEHHKRDTWLETIVGDDIIPDVTPWEAAQPHQDAANKAKAKNIVFGDNVPVGDLHENDSIHFLIKGNLGAERYCAAEIMELLHDMDWKVVARPTGMDGYVACCSNGSHIDEDTIIRTRQALLNIRSAHHVIQYSLHFDLQDLVNSDFTKPHLVDGETLYQYVKQRLVDTSIVIKSLAELNQKGGSFRVTCERIGGPHAFRSPDAEFEIGGAMMEYYSNCKPKMEDYDINIRADVVGNLVILGTQLNVHDLSKDRHFLKFRNAVTVKTNLAYAMVRCANIQPGARVVDPFCGSGTLLLEALELYQGKIHCVGLDVSRRSSEGARENAMAENFGEDVCQFICSDARSLRRHLEDDSVDAIITNLPWGIQTGQNTDLATMYEIFLRVSWYALKDGARVVMLVLRGLQVTRLFKKLSGRYRLLRVQVVRTTNNLPSIIIAEKLAVDELRDAVKGQLAYYSKYVNVAPEVYQAMHNETIGSDI